MTKPKAILGTKFPYLYCCKSANITFNMHAQCSSEHAQPLVNGYMLILPVFRYYLVLLLFRYIIFSCLQGKKENVIKHHGQGCCGKQPFKVVYIWTCILTEPQPMEVSAQAAKLSAGPTPELLAFVSCWKGNVVVMLRRKTSIVRILGQSPFPRGNY